METAKGKTREETINRLADRIDTFEKYTQPHSRLMVELASHLARRFGLAAPDIDAITEAAMLHDIGLYAMAPAYHALPRPLSFESRLDLWRHPVIGEQQMAKRDAMRHAQLLVRWHHEWWNGSGYPDMLAFEDIPVGARILRAVELCAALLADRPYRVAQNEQQTLEALAASAGIECDPYVVKALLSLLDELLVAIHRAEAAGLEAAQRAEAAGLDAANAVSVEPSDASAAEPSEATSVEPSNTTSDAASQWRFPEPPGISELGSLVTAPESTEEEKGRGGEGETGRGGEGETGRLGEGSNSLSFEPDSANEPIEAVPAPAPRSWGEGLNAFVAANPEPLEKEAPKPVLDVTPTARGVVPESPALPKLPPPPSLIESLLARVRTLEIGGSDSPKVLGWKGSRYNRKLLLGFQASVLRQIEFRSIAIPFWSEARLDWYLKAWSKVIYANDPRQWAGVVARANVEATQPLSEDAITRILDEVYVPRVRLANPELRRWFSETDAWWLDNLRRNIDSLDDELVQAQAVALGLQTGDYALSFDEETLELRRPLTTVFWRLAGRAFIGPAGQPHNRTLNQPAEDFIRHSRADLLYLRSPSSHTDRGGAEARSEWREVWVKGGAASESAESSKQTSPQSRQSYLASIDRLLRPANSFKTWAVEYQEPGLASAQDLIDLIKEYRPVKATYSKDVTEVAGGLRSFMIVAEKSSTR